MDPINIVNHQSSSLTIRHVNQGLHHSFELEVPQRHRDFRIVWIKEGSGTLVLDLQRFELTADTIYCISPGQVHYIAEMTAIHGVVISFSPELIGLHDDSLTFIYSSGLFQNYSQETPFIHVRSETGIALNDILDQMNEEYSQSNSLRGEILRSLLRTFLLYLTRQYERTSYQSNAGRNTELVKRFMELLEKNFASKKMVADYADELAVTPNYLNEVVKKVSGFPASYHIQQRITLEAKRQALYAATSMKEVAFNLGFQDIAHFSKYFKRVVGMNFSEFKKDSFNQARS